VSLSFAPATPIFVGRIRNRVSHYLESLINCTSSRVVLLHLVGFSKLFTFAAGSPALLLFPAPPLLLCVISPLLLFIQARLLLLRLLVPPLLLLFSPALLFLCCSTLLVPPLPLFF